MGTNYKTETHFKYFSWETKNRVNKKGKGGRGGGEEEEKGRGKGKRGILGEGGRGRTKGRGMREKSRRNGTKQTKYCTIFLSAKW